MTSTIITLKRVITEGRQPLSQLLRTAKPIISKLNLQDRFNWTPISDWWINGELNGYSLKVELPPYRMLAISSLERQHPTGVWERVPCLHNTLHVTEPIHVIEAMHTGGCSGFRYHCGRGRLEWVERANVQPKELKRILDVVRALLLDLVAQLESEGIQGDDMEFDDGERRRAAGVRLNLSIMRSYSGSG